MLGCYVDYGTDSEQYAWLQRDLASIDRSRTPWVFVGMHAPWCVTWQNPLTAALQSQGSHPLYSCIAALLDAPTPCLLVHQARASQACTGCRLACFGGCELRRQEQPRMSGVVRRSEGVCAC
jgi:hypothetical protein